MTTRIDNIFDLFVEDLGLVYLFTGTSWVDTGGVFQIIMT